MKKILMTAGFASLLAGSALLAQPAQASWAENAQSSQPNYTGTEQSRWRAERSRRNFSYRAPRWHSGYAAYGYAPGYSDYRPSYGYGHPGYGYYRYGY
jgi:hypothetical protein